MCLTVCVFLHACVNPTSFYPVSKVEAKHWSGSAHLLLPPLLVAGLRCASLLSDSYVIAEGRVVTFLLLSLGPPPSPARQLHTDTRN